uniref:Peptidoglycan-recognition protein n=1 Tax=Gopherus evgoodei TaxID=1825980 RepID=A0A8C4WFL9_9SAUR
VTHLCWILHLASVTSSGSEFHWPILHNEPFLRVITPVPYVIIYHTAGSSCISQASCSQLVRSIQNYHMDSNGWADIGYNFLIGEDGRVYEGRGWSTVGHPCLRLERYITGIQVPSAAALNIAQDLIQCAVNMGSLSSSYILKGHRNVKETESPGEALYVITQWPRFQT